MRVKPINLLSLCATLLVLTACTKPAVPDPEQPPEPQAADQSPFSCLARLPLDKAKAVEDAGRQAAEAQRQAIEAAGG